MQNGFVSTNIEVKKLNKIKSLPVSRKAAIK
jgi:hypothetical protein